jgi:DNA-binding PadR family transcriptional regulator
MHVEEKASNWLKETQKGYIRIAVLILLSKKPHHGYEMMKAVEERTSGFWKPTAGGIYPILQDLENSGYVKGEWDQQTKRKRKIYELTETGKKVLERTLAKENQLANSMADLFKEYMKDVLDVEVNKTQMPKTPFALFLEEGKCKPEDTKKILENKRLHIEDMVKNMQKELSQIDKRLAQLEKPKGQEKAKKTKQEQEGET